ncbi:hypothetical protein H2248_012342 [Termitomyces sp. 'cryptogamus']|nr:hypothetical protein H2248_012342 [Termitomyces sp. 'cryptogamus']
MEGQHLHRRRSSKGEDENIVLITRPIEAEPPPDEVLTVSAPPPPRNRVMSSPAHQHTRSLSSVNMGQLPPTGPFRQGFNLQHPTNGINGHPSSSFRSSLAPAGPGHARTRSVSAFTPPVHSPLASSFHVPTPPKTISSLSSPTMYAFPTTSTPTNNSNSAPDGTGATLNPSQPSTSRRHARIHSRNLSVFFPRPGSLPTASIAEDGVQELEIPQEAPVSTVPSAGPSVSMPGHRSRHGGGALPTPLGVGFTFGGRPPSSTPNSSSSSNSDPMTGAPAPIQLIASSRRGHHHKHSMSHSFFSFLEPGSNGVPGSEHTQDVELHTQPTPMPLSPWAPISAFPQSAKAATNGFPLHTASQNGHAQGHHHMSGEDMNMEVYRDDDDKYWDEPPPQGALVAGIIQFTLGAWLWVSGQQIGSLSVTGLGYWIVFDAFGVGLRDIVMRWLDLRPHSGEGETPSEKERRAIRRPYGIAPVQTVLMFGQAVYLMFSSVYVCKETLEHLLLSAGNVEGHHHHHGDEDESLVGIEFPMFLAFITLVSVIWTSLFYDNHSKFVSATGSRTPAPQTLLRSLFSTSKSQIPDPPPTTPLGVMFSNPFAVSPLVFAGTIIFVSILVPVEHHRTCDLLLAALITVVTFNLAYRACTVLGSALLQTAPPRGTPGGKTEAFLRAMREVERHPQVLHLPAPHIWQLTPTPDPASVSRSQEGNRALDEALVVTMELHVRPDLGDDEVLALTRWVWEKCASALRRKEDNNGRGGRGPEVTVGVVRG